QTAFAPRRVIFVDHTLAGSPVKRTDGFLYTLRCTVVVGLNGYARFLHCGAGAAPVDAVVKGPSLILAIGFDSRFQFCHAFTSSVFEIQSVKYRPRNKVLPLWSSLLHRSI